MKTPEEKKFTRDESSSGGDGSENQAGTQPVATPEP